MFDAHIYSTRRNKLKSILNNGIALFLGNNYAPMNYPANTYPFRQDSNFLYFFGLNDARLAAIIDFESGKEILFGDDVDIDDIIWMGTQASLKDKSAQCGVKETRTYNDLEKYISENSGRQIHYLPPYRADNSIVLEKLLGIKPSSQKKFASIDLIKAVVSLRAVKEPCEIEALEEAQKIGYEMHSTALKMTKPGIYEREIAGAMEGVCLSHGAVVSFPVILTINGQTLHNHCHENILKEGDLLLVDAGAEAPNNYCSDHTRTYPVGGKFTQKQKEIYEIVLKANKEAIQMIKPGITFQSVHFYACKIIAEGLKAIGLMKGNTDEAVKQGAHAMFLPHGLGHMMGLDVHDMEDLGENYVGYDEETKRSTLFGTAYLRMGRKLKEGFVVTVEPGIYFIPALIQMWEKENKFSEFINYSKVNEYLNFGGIRIEDDILVTKDGYRNLGKPIPKEVDDIENLMSC
ncbi:MAG: aminopeptidase P family protein [Bacteroidales bacterium]|nr:aminopeptidase P family protein [Bacteroidales bacterium]